MDNTRSAPRININLKLISRVDEEIKQGFSLAKGNAFEVDAVDISMLGMGLVSKYFLPKGLRVELEIDGKLFNLDNPMKIKGEIRYCRYVKPSTYRCGVKFINIPDECKEKITQFITNYERRKEPRLKLSE